jgi:uroporphyrinogen-III decarboxylase
MAAATPRARFLSYVRGETDARPVVSPFLPDPDVVRGALVLLGLPAGGDAVENEARLARVLDYEPMFMTDCPGLIFPWRQDEGLSDGETVVSTLRAGGRTWVKRVSRRFGEWGDESGFPVRTEADHELIAACCAEVAGREPEIRAYFRAFRGRVGDEGVVVIGHPHVTWLAYQASQQTLVYHLQDHPGTFRRSMEAVHGAALQVFRIAMEEGVDFMSESCAGLEMSSPRSFDEVDLPVLRSLSAWTHERGGLFWYHNCGLTRRLIASGRFGLFQPDVLETIAPPPEGDNDLAESRRALDPRICTKGNFPLGLLRDGSVDEVRRATREMTAAVTGFRHILSTADAVLPGTPPENLIAFVRTAREASG